MKVKMIVKITPVSGLLVSGHPLRSSPPGVATRVKMLAKMTAKMTPNWLQTRTIWDQEPRIRNPPIVLGGRHEP